MKKLLYILLISVFASFAADTFEYDKKTGIATENGKFLFKIDYDRNNDRTYVYNEKETKLIIINIIRYRDPTAISSSNPDGKQDYFEWVFPTLGKKGESSSTINRILARNIYNDHLIVNGQLDTAAVSNFIFVNGNSESEKMKAILRR